MAKSSACQDFQRRPYTCYFICLKKSRECRSRWVWKTATVSDLKNASQAYMYLKELYHRVEEDTNS